MGMPIYPPCLANTLAGSEIGAGSFQTRSNIPDGSRNGEDVNPSADQRHPGGEIADHTSNLHGGGRVGTGPPRRQGNIFARRFSPTPTSAVTIRSHAHRARWLRMSPVS